jgi:hypothetical protein
MMPSRMPLDLWQQIEIRVARMHNQEGNRSAMLRAGLFVIRQAETSFIDEFVNYYVLLPP